MSERFETWAKTHRDRWWSLRRYERLAMVDVQVRSENLDVVEIQYEVLADMLRDLGWTKREADDVAN